MDDQACYDEGCVQARLRSSEASAKHRPLQSAAMTRPLPNERRHLPSDWSDDAGYPDELVNQGLDRIAEGVYQARRRAGWTQRQLASRCGVDQPTISRLERGVLSGISLRRLARIFGCVDVIEVRER